MPQGVHPLRGSFVSYTVHWKKCDQICQSLGLDLIEFDHRLAVQLSTDSTLGTRWATCLGHSSLGGLVTCLDSPGSGLLARIWTIKVFYQLLYWSTKLCSVCTKSPTNSIAARFAICSWTRKSGGHPILTSHCSAQAPGTDWIHAGGHRPVARQVQATELGEMVIKTVREPRRAYNE